MPIDVVERSGPLANKQERKAVVPARCAGEGEVTP